VAGPITRADGARLPVFSFSAFANLPLVVPPGRDGGGGYGGQIGFRLGRNLSCLNPRIATIVRETSLLILCAVSTFVLFLCMPKNAILRARIDPGRKERVERILAGLGLTPTQVINMLFAQIERRKAIPFRVSLADDEEMEPSEERVAEVWNDLDDTDFSYLRHESKTRRSVSR
jgi:addiction module RelB/DinJ family antitoxin